MGIAGVSGSASGIGAAVRARLEADGDRVIGVDLRSAEVEADLSTAEGRSSAIAGVREACGGALDRLVLCAGLGPQVGDARIAQVNYFGAVDLLDGLLPCLSGAPDAAAVVIASNSAQLGPFQDHPVVLALLDGDEARACELLADDAGYIAYGGSKHALSRAVRRRAAEWGGAGVRLNAIAPGATQTPLLEGTEKHPVWGKGVDALPIPLGRRATPAEVADIIAFLLGPEARYIHGSIVYADGGTDASVRPDFF
ncbi:MAG: SDR family oxidoreductase [Deltaproteobacteria bacterium]|nr:SDR family oxidoreductase [Deltaproteobacteria bacterium]